MTTPSQIAPFPSVVKKNALENCYRCVQTIFVAVILAIVMAVFHPGSSPYIAFAFTGAFIVHVVTQPSRREFAIVAASAGIFGAIYYRLHGEVSGFYGSAIGLPGNFLGLGSLLLVTLQWLWSPASDKSVPSNERARSL